MRFLIVWLASAIVVLGADPVDTLVGVWKVNEKKSKHYTETGTMTVEKLKPNTLRISYDLIDPSGKRSQMSITIVCDGREHRASWQDDPGVTETCAPNNLNYVAKKNGKVYQQTTSTVVGDSLTQTRKLLQDGKWEEVVMVWQRK